MPPSKELKKNNTHSTDEIPRSELKIAHMKKTNKIDNRDVYSEINFSQVAEIISAPTRWNLSKNINYLVGKTKLT